MQIYLSNTVSLYAPRNCNQKLVHRLSNGNNNFGELHNIELRDETNFGGPGREEFEPRQQSYFNSTFASWHLIDRRIDSFLHLMNRNPLLGNQNSFN